MAVTHQDIANKLGISRSLVTLALQRTRHFSMSEETRRQIEETARSMGYRPRNRTTRNIGLIVTPLRMQVHSSAEFIYHIERSLREHGYRLVLINPDLPEGQMLDEIINPKTLDGVLLMDWAEGRFAPLLSPHLPGILLSEEEVQGSVERIATDVPQTLKHIIEHLMVYNHQRIALISSCYGSSDYYRRVEKAIGRIFETLKLAAGNLYIIQSDSGEAAARLLSLMEQPLPPTAAITADPERALLLLNGLQAAGKCVPQEMSVVSMMDDRLFARTTPALTATTVDDAAVARRVVERLLVKINTPETVEQHEFIAGRVISRASVAMPTI